MYFTKMCEKARIWIFQKPMEQYTMRTGFLSLKNVYI